MSSRPPESCAGSPGFTLLEVLVAFAITALLVTAAVRVHTSIMQAQRERIYERGRDVTAQRALDRIERELLGTQLLAKPEPVPREEFPWVFQGTDGGQEPADALRFVTTSARRTGIETPGLRLVSYGGRRGLDERASLFRGEEPLSQGLPEAAALEGDPALDGVAQFQLRYLDPDTGSWQESWDSTQQDTLPGAVEITLQLAERNAAGEEVLGPALVRVVPLPVRPITAKGEAEKECAMGVTVSQCAEKPELQQFLEVSFTGPERDEINALIKAVGDQCVVDENQSTELAELLNKLGEKGIKLDDVGCTQ